MGGFFGDLNKYLFGKNRETQNHVFLCLLTQQKQSCAYATKSPNLLLNHKINEEDENPFLTSS